MKKYDLSARLATDGGETVLGAKDLGTHNCYLIYGSLAPGNEPRVLKPGKGHEEIICVVAGSMRVVSSQGPLSLRAGEAFYLKGEESAEASAEGGQCVYVAAGGHVSGGDHHH